MHDALVVIKYSPLSVLIPNHLSLIQWLNSHKDSY